MAEAARSAARPGPARVVCGKGNNGGDGLVCARLLAETGYEVEALLLWPADELSADATANLGRFEGAAVQVGPEEVAPALEGAGVIVDAIFGTGFSGAPRAPADAAIEAINDCGAPVVAADIASGVDASTGEVEGAAVEADVTVSFHRAKLGHWIAPGKAHTGELRVAEIGIPAGAPGEPAAGVIADGVLGLAPAADAELDQVRLRPGAGGGRLPGPDGRRVHGGARRRSERAPATPRWPCPPTWRRSSRSS